MSLMHVVAVVVMPMTVVVIFHYAFGNTALVTTSWPVVVLMVVVKFEIFFVNTTGMDMMIVSIMIVIPMINVPFGGVTAVQAMLVAMIFMMLVVLVSIFCNNRSRCRQK